MHTQFEVNYSPVQSHPEILQALAENYQLSQSDCMQQLLGEYVSVPPKALLTKNFSKAERDELILEYQGQHDEAQFATGDFWMEDLSIWEDIYETNHPELAFKK